MRDQKNPHTNKDIKELVKENARLNKILQVLMDRVEQEMDQQQDSFTIFQTAIKLEETVIQRTNELKDLNSRLMKELEERQKVEEKLQIAKKQAEEANKSKTTFLATASHDLRQPLNAARLFIGSLAGADIGAKNAHYVARIGNSLDALDDLLGILLNISQLDSGGIIPRFCHFYLQDLLNRVVPDYIQSGQERGLDIRMVPSSCIVYSDPRFLETILRNFLSNAVRYTKKGGVLVGCRMRAGKIILQVFDTGIGIKGSQLDDIFEEFIQVHEDHTAGGRGIGLGLSIVRRVSGLLSAPVEVRSTVGKGSVFSIALPQGDDRKTTRLYLDRTSNAPLSGNFTNRVMVVIDNDKNVLEGMTALLEKWGADIISGMSADICLAQLIEKDIIPDIIIADYHLNGDDTGIKAVTEIHTEFSGLSDGPIPAIIITSDRDPKLEKMLALNDLPLIHKPVAPAKLHALILHLLP